jgi:hypothetical protein
MERIKEAEQQISAVQFSSDEESDDEILNDKNEISTIMNDDNDDNEDVFATSANSFNSTMMNIPILPCGRHLTFEVKSTWGDPYYVGCAGIELFDDAGEIIVPRDLHRDIVANPTDVNCLEGACGNDPRTSDKLFDGWCHTCDDLHTWLTPWGLTPTVTIDVDLSETKVLSMLRIWNYNKNRQQSFRGMRLVKICLDGTVIFEGEIRRACGSLKGPDECSDAVLFTTEDEILSKIEMRDENKFAEFRTQAPGGGGGGGDVSDTLVQRIKRDMERDRPSTASKQRGIKLRRGRSCDKGGVGDEVDGTVEFGLERPVTRAGSKSPEMEESAYEKLDSDNEQNFARELAGIDEPAAEPAPAPVPALSAAAPDGPAADEPFLAEEDEDDFDLDDMLADVKNGAISFSPEKSKALQKTATAAAVSLSPAPPADITTYACDGVTLKIHATHEGPLAPDVNSTTPHASKYVGLGGIRLIRYDKESGRFSAEDLQSSRATMDATPRDLRSMGYDGDQRVLSNLFDAKSKNMSTDDHDMWLVPDSLTAGVAGADGSVEIRVKFGTRLEDLWGVEIYNYNKVGVGENGDADEDVFDEDTLRGVKVMTISLKNSGGSTNFSCGAFSVRRAPSCSAFDYKQTLVLGKPHAISFAELMPARPEKTAARLADMYKRCPFVKQDYETPFLPAGQLVKMVVHSSWGDPYYVGLDGFEILDVTGAVVSIEGVGATPHSLRSIGVSDGRVPENLVANKDSWLAPLAASLGNDMKSHFAPGHSYENVLFFCMDEPIHIAGIRIKNYSRTKERGVRDFSLWVDGHIVYRGFMNRADKQAQTGVDGHVVLFCGVPAVLNALNIREKNDLFYCGAETQDVECIDEMVVRERSKFSALPADPSAFGVKPDLNRRPKTGQRR